VSELLSPAVQTWLHSTDQDFPPTCSQLPARFTEPDPAKRALTPDYTPAAEGVIAVGTCAKVTLAGRQLQLAVIVLSAASTSEPDKAAMRVKLREHRNDLLGAIKLLVSSAVKMGAAGLLPRCNICQSSGACSSLPARA
jgi:hypothetical protein